MQHNNGDAALTSMVAGTVEGNGSEQWRVELAELLARAESEGRELTVEEWAEALGKMSREDAILFRAKVIDSRLLLLEGQHPSSVRAQVLFS